MEALAAMAALALLIGLMAAILQPEMPEPEEAGEPAGCPDCGRTDYHTQWCAPCTPLGRNLPVAASEPGETRCDATRSGDGTRL